MIKVDRIYIQNFKRFRQVEIKPDPSSGIFIFIGKNYLGKSNFLNAICWCLYEEIPFTQSIEQKNLLSDGILNTDAEKENEFDEIKVDIQVSDENNTYRFVRSMRPTQDSKFNVYRLDKNDWKLVPNPETVRNVYLPKNLRKYFIFAGENLEHLYKPGFEKELRDGVWSVSDVTILDRSIEHLNNIISTFRKEVGKGIPELEEMTEKMDKLKNEIEKNNEKIKDKEIEISKLKEQLNEYKKEQKTYSNIKDLAERRDKLESEFKIKEEDFDKIKIRINELLTEKTSFLYLKEILIKSYNDLHEYKLPADIEVAYIKEILNKGVCICGRDINKSDGSYIALNKLMTEYEPVSVRSAIGSDKVIISSILDGLYKLKKDLELLTTERAKIYIQKNEIDRELKEIKEKLGNSSNKEVSNIEIALTDLENRIGEHQTKLGELKERNNNDLNNLVKIEEQFDKYSKLKEKNLEAIKIKDFLQISEKIIHTIREHITNRIRDILSHNTEKYFRELFWDEQEYELIEFNEFYGINVKMKNQVTNKNELSIGEGKVLALATMRAIADLSGFNETPIFFDAPLSNLGGDIKRNLLEILHDYAPNKQMFIFSLDDHEIKEYIKDRVPKNRVYQLQKDPINQQSTIIVPYHDKRN